MMTRKHIAFVGALLVVSIGIIAPRHPTSLARTPTPNLSQVSAQDIRLTNLRPCHHPPLWSPDGQWTAGSNFTEGLYIQRTESGTERKQLGRAGVPRREIAWSWDSKKLFYQVNQPIEEPPFTKRWIESVEKSSQVATIKDGRTCGTSTQAQKKRHYDVLLMMPSIVSISARTAQPSQLPQGEM